MSDQIHIRQTDDWVAVYKNGQNVWSTHSCTIGEGLEALGIEFTYEWKDYQDDIDEFFPESLNGSQG